MQIKLNKEQSKVQVQKVSQDEIRELLHMLNDHEMEVKGDPYLMLVLALREELNLKLHQMTYPTKKERSFQMSIAQAVALFILLGETDAPLSSYGHVVYREIHAQLHHVMIALDLKLTTL